MAEQTEEPGPQAASAADQAEGDSEGEAGAGLNFDRAHGAPSPCTLR